MFIRTLRNLRTLDPGFKTSNLISRRQPTPLVVVESEAPSSEVVSKHAVLFAKVIDHLS